VVAAEADIRRVIEQMGGTDPENNALLKSAVSAVDKARRDLDNTTVVAASDGVITDLQAEVGQYAGTGTAVLTLISVHDVWIRAEFTENNLGNMMLADRAEILFDVLPGEVFDAQVRSIGLGVSGGGETTPGTLPSLSNNRDWLRQSQRFPVIVEFDPAQDEMLRNQLRIGGQASVVVYTRDGGILNLLARWHIRFLSWLSYAY
jgi:multidrug resistance efflux pump